MKPLNELTADDILSMSDKERDEILGKMFPNQSREVAIALLPLAAEVDRHLNELRGTVRNLVTVCEKLIDYRRRVGPLNFQLEKADDYIRMIEREVAAAKQ